MLATRETLRPETKSRAVANQQFSDIKQFLLATKAERQNARMPQRPRLDHHRHFGDNDDLRVWCDRWSEALLSPRC